MSAYRFCRTDDIQLLVNALKRCWSPHFPDDPEPTVAAFKRDIRDVQTWCSSCMVAADGSDPVGVLIGDKRAGATRVQRIAVHPDHLRKGHARHLLTSLSSKLAILGPPRIVAEIPAANLAAAALFESCGYQEEEVLTDYVLPADRSFTSVVPPPDDTFLVPITMEDVTSNDLLANLSSGCWERAKETLVARGDEYSGLAIATTDRIAALVLKRTQDGGAAEIGALFALPGEDAEDVEVLLSCLTGALARRQRGTIRFPRVGPAEPASAWLASWGFEPEGSWLRYAGRATSV